MQGKNQTKVLMMEGTETRDYRHAAHELPCRYYFVTGRRLRWQDFCDLAILSLLLLSRGAGTLAQPSRSWPFVGDSNLIEIAGEAFDTTTSPSVLHEHLDDRRSAIDNATFNQYYVQLKPDADPQYLLEATGVTFKAYVPNNAYIVLASKGTALNVAAMQDVQWVGRRPSRHKVSLSLAEAAITLRKPLNTRARKQTTRPYRRHSDSWLKNPDEDKESAVSLHVTVHTKEDWDSAMYAGDGTSDGEAEERTPLAFANRCYRELTASGLDVLDAYESSPEKVVVVIKSHELRDTLEWLSAQPEAIWVEQEHRYLPFVSSAAKLLADGPSEASENSKRPSTIGLGLDGRGQIIGIADTGLDWDNCFFWQSGIQENFPEKGVAPPFNDVTPDRRKLISYNWHQDCKKCGRCPVSVEDDVKIFTSANGALDAMQSMTLRFPEVDEDPTTKVQKSAIAPRFYSSAGATVDYSIRAVTANQPKSVFDAPGSGAYEISVSIQIFIIPRADTDSFDPKNKDHWKKCLNKCENKGNSLEVTQAVLNAAPGGYGVIITNVGVERSDGGSTGAHIILRGSMQFKTALKPCGDNGDDRKGHGTHISSVAAGAVYTPKMQIYDEEQRHAQMFNGMAPGAKIYFEDVMQNASPDCNIPGKVCARVNEMTIPVDLANDLFLKPYQSGARIHLNSWGCDFRTTSKPDRPGSCNKYTTKARDIDKFVFEHPDFLVIFAAGENGMDDEEGSIAEPGTCKNCLTVGTSHTFQLKYREALQKRDPQVDICFPCQHPYFCSRSELINEKFMISPSIREIEMAKLAKCCNDTLHIFYPVENMVVEENEWWTLHLPDLSKISDKIAAMVRQFKWTTKGASITYDFKAEVITQSPASGLETFSGIQVFVLNRQDFSEYFEEGTEFCPSGTPEVCAESQLRSNPCITSRTRQVNELEYCMSNADGTYSAGKSCATPEYDFPTTPGNYERRPWLDRHCHSGPCKRKKMVDGKLKIPLVKDETTEGTWGFKDEDGCGGIPNCCNDEFLKTMCLNENCTAIKSRIRGSIRHRDLTELVKFGFGFAVRNMHQEAIRLTGRVEIRNVDYPCTLKECCTSTVENLVPACCAENYRRYFAAEKSCSQCPVTEKPGVLGCHPSEENNLPSWTSRGPGKSDYLKGIGGAQFKPELVAPGIQTVGANSDGLIPSNGIPNDLQVQCGLPSKRQMDDLNCRATSAAEYDNTTALNAKTGSSVSAALIAGSAALIRQYLLDGYYPTGLKNLSNTLLSKPSAALVKAMLINSARSVGGTIDTYTYKYPPFCDPQVQVCEKWTKPKPWECKQDPTFFDVDCYVRRDKLPKTPNVYEGYGRPVLSNVLWTNASNYSIYIDNTYVSGGWQRTYIFPLEKISPEFPVKVTLVWTDEPGTPEAVNTLVNDLDLIVQLSTIKDLYNPNQGKKITISQIVSYFGNDAIRNKSRDRANVVEEVTIDDQNTKTNMTIVILGVRVPKWMKNADNGQHFSLVVTGQIKLKYYNWVQSRSALYLFIDKNSRGSSVDQERFEYAFAFLDISSDNFVNNDEMNFRIPDISKFTVGEMVKEADENGDGVLGLSEFITAASVARSQAQIPVDPIKEFTIADPSLLADKDSSLDDATSQATACSVDLLWLSFALAICWTVTYIYNPILV